MLVTGCMALLGTKHALGPVLVRRTMRPLIAPEIAPIADFPPDLAAGFAAREAELAALGFQAAGRFAARTEAGGNQAHVALMRGPNGATLATIAAIKAPDGWLTYVELGTRFRDAGDVYLGTAPSPGIFVSAPEQVKGHLPPATDAATLWRVYRAMVAAHRPGVPAIEIPEGGEAGFLAEGVARAIAHQAAIGHYTAEPEAGSYRLTWWGAYRSCWLLLWPLKPLRARMQRARAETLLRRFS